MKKNILYSIIFIFFSFQQPVLASEKNIIFFTENYPPLSYLENDKIVGASVEVIEEAHKRLGISPDIRLRAWKSGYNATLNGQNKAIFSTARLPKREKLFKWVGPLFTYGIYFVKLKRNPIVVNSIDDAKKHTITVAQGSADYIRLRDLGFKRLDISPKAVSHARKLINFRADLWLASELNYKKRAESLGINPDNFETTYKLGEESLYIAFSKQTNEKVINQWQSAIDDMKKDGTYKTIIDKYIN